MSISSSYVALIILQHYGSRTAEKEGFTGVKDNLRNICKNLAMCARIFARHLNPGLIKVEYGCLNKLLGEALYKVCLITGNILETCVPRLVAKILAGVGVVFVPACFVSPQGIGERVVSFIFLFCYN